MGAMENAFEDRVQAPAGPDPESPLDAETLKALPDGLMPGEVVFYPACPFCGQSFGTCGHPTGVPPIVREDTAP